MSQRKLGIVLIILSILMFITGFADAGVLVMLMGIARTFVEEDYAA